MNIGNCEYANTGKPFEIAEGEELKCPNGCDGSMLVEVKSGPNLKVIVGGIAVAALHRLQHRAVVYLTFSYIN